MNLKDKIIVEIKKIYDPEIPVNIYELGLIYDIIVQKDNSVKIKMTLTTPNCPVASRESSRVSLLARAFGACLLPFAIYELLSAVWG